MGKALSALTGAALLDNHLWNDPIFRAYGADGISPLPAQVFELAEAVRQLSLKALIMAPRGHSHVLTNYLSDSPGAAGAVEQLRGIAADRGAVFVPVWLSCPVDQLAQRVVRPERQERLKLRDPVQLRDLLIRRGNLSAPPDAIRIDTSQVEPSDAALLIVSHAGALF
ncbi:hypothetical protein E7T09_05295 [Deinococcus sp. KSM4-11]|nr:hypothetical protein E7T09_05295 [Deinococcus sp. KSM4-11]